MANLFPVNLPDFRPLLKKKQIRKNQKRPDVIGAPHAPRSCVCID